MDDQTPDKYVRARAQELCRQFDWKATYGATEAEYAAHMQEVDEDLRARPIDARTLVCLLALERENADVEHTAWLRMQDDFRENRRTRQESGQMGGKARGDRFAPLKEKALELALAGRYPNPHAAAVAIESAILALAADLNLSLSEFRATQTIADWLRSLAFDLL